ncbi:hypothetical protein B0H94_11363 [Salsuginibacillus halophilus]|uniref:AbrB family transcriptional regulator n=1 Tax=Salsuginibacillus halophilus TaxID=517424 RepID=A0A2P8H970_9BACI|nr:AbrB family transcriptional regulator [Salsuginibacillus halophilus]PSL42777.1 hypothetical protein B0H94_11363 [Salsuginibacillus halophilus]
MGQKFIFLALAISAGGLLNLFGMPAGWLLGAIMTGIIWGLTRERLIFEGWPFKTALAFVGTNIGLLMEQELFAVIGAYFAPLLLVIAMTIAMGLGLGVLLYRWTELDRRTAFFCCVPGGASEVISVSGEYGADQRIVAAFHTTRITLFVLTIPLLVGLFSTASETTQSMPETALTLTHFWLFPFIIAAALFLQRVIKLPAGGLLFAIILGFIFGEFIVQPTDAPAYLGGLGQALIGAMVGVRFERQTLGQLKRIGKASAGVLGLYFGASWFIGGTFWLLTDLSYMLSVLSTVPAGAAEMAATAFALSLQPSLVTSLHIIRVIVLFLLLPFLIKRIKNVPDG